MKNSFEDFFSSFEDIDNSEDFEENSLEERGGLSFLEIEDDDLPEIPNLEE